MMKSHYDHSRENGFVILNPITKEVRSSNKQELVQQQSHASSLTKIMMADHNIVKNAVNEALDTFVSNDNDTDNSETVNPVPIDPFGIQEITGEVPLSATWKNLKDPTTDLIRWVFSTPQSDIVARRPRPREEEDDDEPLEAFSSGDDHEDDASSDDSSNAQANLKNAANTISTGNATTARLFEKCWEDRFQELLQYREKFGNCLVPRTWISNTKLSSWVKRQRYQYKLWCKNERSTLTKERIESLNKVGFTWSSHNALWDEKLDELKEFSKQHGHCNVPTKFPENPQLAIWVRSQRRKYKLLCQEAEQQQQHQQQQQQQQQQHECSSNGDNRSAHQNLPKSRKRGSQQRYMTRDRIEKLQAVGFVFAPRRGTALSQTKR